MRASDLRTILLIQAVEASDTKGELLRLAEREAATQEVLRGASDVHEAFSPGTPCHPLASGSSRAEPSTCTSAYGCAHRSSTGCSR
jgi:hypothetical protein